MQKTPTIRLLGAAVLLALSAGAMTGARAAGDAAGPHPSAKRAHSEPPSAARRVS